MLWLCMINPSGADPNLPIVTVCQSRPTAPMWLAPMDLVIGDTVALEVGAGRVAPDHLGPARVDALEPPGFTDRGELDRWVLGVVVYDWRVRQGPTAVFNPKHRGEGAAIEVRRRLDLDLRGRVAEHVRAREHQVIAEIVDREGRARVGVLLIGKQEDRGARGRWRVARDHGCHRITCRCDGWTTVSVVGLDHAELIPVIFPHDGVGLVRRPGEVGPGSAATDSW